MPAITRRLYPWKERPGAGAKQFALKTKGNPIGVAEYQLQPKLPAELKRKLPTAKQLADAVKGEMGRMKDELQRSWKRAAGLAGRRRASRPIRGEAGLHGRRHGVGLSPSSPRLGDGPGR